MTCARVRAAFSRLRDADLPSAADRSLRRHLDSCPGCREGWRTWNALFDDLRGLPEPSPVDLATPVIERLDLERRDPGLASLFRPLTHSRPYLLSSLVTAFLLWLCAAVPLLVRLDRQPTLPRVAFSRGFDHAGTAPLAPAASVVPPRESRGSLSHRSLSEMREGSVFLETVIAPDGRVARVRLLGGDTALPGDLLDALSGQRFEPGRYRGQAVPVAVYRLISRLEVIAPPV